MALLPKRLKIVRIFTLLAFFLVQQGAAQSPVLAKVKPVIYRHLITAGTAIPLASFGETHYPGITSGYIRKMDRIRNQDSFKRRKTGWITAASLSHYFGRKENTGQSSFRYRHYSLLEIQGGMSWAPLEKLNFSLRTGPGLGYYNKIFRFTITGQLQGSYSIGPKTIITPGFAFLKEPGSDALWITSLQLGFLF
jgi:hypothetical protein